MDKAEKPRPHLIAIQALRGIAALVVTLGHAVTEVQQARDHFPGLPFDFGIGVDIFFIVSGFIMVFTSLSTAGTPSAPAYFLQRRFIRIVPLYWFYTVAMLAAILLVPSLLNNSSIDTGMVVSSFLFFPYRNTIGEFTPVLALGWTLNYEMFFYLLFALALLAKTPRACFLALSVLIVASLVVGGSYGAGPWAFWGNSIILEFLFGAVLGMIFLTGKVEARAWIFWLLLAAMVPAYLALLSFSDIRALHLGIPAAFISTAFILFVPEHFFRHITAFGKYVGDSSYSLYLCHPFALGIVKAVWMKLHGGSMEQPLVFIALAVIASLIAARLSYLMIEVPVTRYLSHFIKRRKPDHA